MKTFLVSVICILSLSLAPLVRATGPEYFSSRDSIKKEVKSVTSSQNIIYLGVINPNDTKVKYAAGFLVPYRSNLKIEDLVPMTSFKGQKAGIVVMRSKNRTEPIFRCIYEPGSKIDFVLQPGDVVWIDNPNAVET